MTCENGCGEVAKPSRKARHQQKKQEILTVMNRHGALPLLISSLLFLMLAVFAVYAVLVLVGTLGRLVFRTETAFTILGWVLDTCFPLLLFFLVGPLFLARLRMAGRLYTGRMPLLREVFYYFSKRRYFRSLVLLFCGVLFAAPLGAVVTFSYLGAQRLYFALFLVNFTPVVALLLLAATLLGALLLSGGVLYLTGVFTPFLALMVGNGELSLREGILRTLSLGWRHRNQIFWWHLRILKNLLLSLLTVGVLYVWWYAHDHLLTYTRLIMTFSYEEELP